jgi:hypothetical protein
MTDFSSSLRKLTMCVAVDKSDTWHHPQGMGLPAPNLDNSHAAEIDVNAFPRQSSDCAVTLVLSRKKFKDFSINDMYE